jgi:phosphoenolpyruvate synthase/pyruvate phosphate dikinase
VFLFGMDAHIIDMSDERCADASLTGGKGSSLALLAKVVLVPSFFCVTSKVFTLMFNDVDTQQLISDLQRETEYAKIDAASKALRSHLKHKSLPESVGKEIAKAYEKLCADMQQKDVSVAVKSRQRKKLFFLKKKRCVRLQLQRIWQMHRLLANTGA